MSWKPWMSASLGLAAGVALIALLPANLLFHYTAATTPAAAASSGERWACAMMDFIGNAPGDCPVCGMTLAKVTAGELSREQTRRMGLQTSTIVKGPAIATVRAYGAVTYDDRTARPVIPRVAGRVLKRHAGALHPGMSVRAGDPLIDLYSPEVYASQGELAAAVKLGDERTIRALRARFERWNLEPVAEAIVRGGEPTDRVTIYSPFPGRVVTSDEGGSMAGTLPEVGEEVMPDRVLVRLLDPQAFMLVIQVPEARARWVREGQPVKLATDDFGELADLQATVSWVAPELNLEIRAREIHVHLRDELGRLLPGSLVNARIQVALTTELTPADWADRGTWGEFALIPKTAVLSTGVRQVAWKVAERQRDGRLRFALAPLALGPRLEDEAGNDLYVVRVGLAVGDEVATQGGFLVDSQAQLAGTPSLLFPIGASAPTPAHQH
jgi:membrane fusion protein, copper/silver efflux system